MDLVLDLVFVQFRTVEDVDQVDADWFGVWGSLSL